MNEFAASWLDLREPADAKARQSTLLETLKAYLDRTAAISAPLNVLDLGSGTGSNLRWLAPRLERAQTWTCCDIDALLLNALPRSSETIQIRSQQIDLATDFQQLDIPGGTLITASALLDLVSDDWVQIMTDQVVSTSSIAFFALTYCGTFALDPATADDGRLLTAINHHQRRDKGFGPALGPTAAAVTATALRDRGFDVHTEHSDWRLESTEAALQRALIVGWCEAAREAAPGSWINAWLSQRLGQIESSDLRITVCHKDLLALPRAAG